MVYNDDLEVCLGNELVQFLEFVNAFKDEQDEGVSQENFTYQLIFKKEVQGSFPNGDSTPHVFGADGQQPHAFGADGQQPHVFGADGQQPHVFGADGQQLRRRTFILKINTNKNRLRTSMCNYRLSQLTLMSIEADIQREINFEDVVTDFAKKKTRKVSLLKN